MHLVPLIQDLAVIFATASLVSFVFQRIRQPVVLGYLVAGVIVGPHTPPFSFVTDLEGIKMWAELGVVFLMFSLGLEFSFRKLLRVGITAGFTACFEVLFMIALGFGAAKLAGWSTTDGILLGAVLSISSTAIIIKTLEELKLKSERFAQIIFGILVVEDLLGILLLVGLSLLGGPETSSGTFAWEALKLFLIVGAWIGAGLVLIPRLVNYLGKRASDEALTLLALALCLGLVVFAERLHYSGALGAFVMGSLLAECEELHRIDRLIKPLRDVFAAVFFVSIGMLLDPAVVAANWLPILGITALTIFGKVASTGLGALMTGQDRRTSLQVGFSLAQIGELSFLIAGLGIARPELYPIAISVSIVTTFTTPYLIRYIIRASPPSLPRAPRQARPE